MAESLKDYVAEHPVDRERVEAHKECMLAEVRTYRLRELREQAGLTQQQLLERIGVGQREVSKIEFGDLDSAKIGTIRTTSKPMAAASPSSMWRATRASRSPEARNETPARLSGDRARGGLLSG